MRGRRPNRRAVASFEEPVRNVRDQYGFIDLFWPKVVLVEHKSFGKDLGKAGSQAMQYVQDLARDDQRRKEIPRYIIVSDFARIALHDLEENTSVTFPLVELHQHIHDFAFIPGHGPMSTLGAERRHNPFVADRSAGWRSRL